MDILLVVNKGSGSSSHAPDLLTREGLASAVLDGCCSQGGSIARQPAEEQQYKLTCSTRDLLRAMATQMLKCNASSRFCATPKSGPPRISRHQCRAALNDDKAIDRGLLDRTDVGRRNLLLSGSALVAGLAVAPRPVIAGESKAKEESGKEDIRNSDTARRPQQLARVVSGASVTKLWQSPFMAQKRAVGVPTSTVGTPQLQGQLHNLNLQPTIRVTRLLDTSVMSALSSRVDVLTKSVQHNVSLSEPHHQAVQSNPTQPTLHFAGPLPSPTSTLFPPPPQRSHQRPRGSALAAAGAVHAVGAGAAGL